MPTRLPQKMRFIEMKGVGGPDVLKVSERPLPVPKEHEVLIEVHAAGVNRPDLAQREGKYPPPPGASSVLGLEVAGVVAATGENSALKVGERVCALVAGGGYAEYSVVHEGHCLPIPKSFSMEEAAGIPENYFTVWANVFQIGRLKRGNLFLIHGGAGGIGTTAIQLAHAFGAEVYTTAGTDRKCAVCKELGAKYAFNYKTQAFDEEIARLTSGQGVDVILDMIGGSYTERNLNSLAVQGRLVQIAFQQGATASVNLARIMQRRLTLTGSTLRPRSIDDKTRIARELQEIVWPYLERREVKIVVDKVFPFSQVKEAHEYLERGDHVGKVILKVK